MISTVSDTAKSKRGSRKRHLKPAPLGTVSLETRNRLHAEAQHPAFEGMNPGAIREYIDERLAVFLSKKPWWYGHTDDKKHNVSQKNYAYERQQAVLRDIAAKERVRLYELGYQARKKGGYKTPYDDAATYVAFEPALDARSGEIAISVEEQPVSV
ncbi:MAG: hypothetical protein QM706_15940 [Nitrospira sp.]